MTAAEHYRYTPPVVQYVKTRNGRTPEPPLDPSWTDLEKLRWSAALVEIETGLRVRVSDAKYSIGCRPQHGYFSISVSHSRGGSSSGAHSFNGAWEYLNGIKTGAEATRYNLDAEVKS